MKYFLIKNNLKETGDVGGFSLMQYIKGKIFDSEYGIIPDSIEFNQNLGSRAKVTDFLWPGRLSPRYGLLYSDKAYQVIQGFNLPDNKIIPINAIKNGKPYSYHLLLYMHSSFDAIDLSTLEIDIVNREFGKLEYTLRKMDNPAKFAKNIMLKNQYPGYDKKENDRGTKLVRMKLKPNFDLDLFTFGYLYSHSIISERLMQSFIKNKITGLQYEEVGFMTVMN